MLRKGDIPEPPEINTKLLYLVSVYIVHLSSNIAQKLKFKFAEQLQVPSVFDGRRTVRTFDCYLNALKMVAGACIDH